MVTSPDEGVVGIMLTDYAHNAKILRNLRNWSNENLPTYGSWLGYDLGAQVLESCATTGQAAMKEIYHSLPYSEPQLRRRLRQFEQDGWIIVGRNHADQRNFLVSPTGKMLSSYSAYFRIMTTLTGDLRAI